jgi:hypothetical protein
MATSYFISKAMEEVAEECVTTVDEERTTRDEIDNLKGR